LESFRAAEAFLDADATSSPAWSTGARQKLTDVIAALNGHVRPTGGASRRTGHRRVLGLQAAWQCRVDSSRFSRWKNWARGCSA